MNKNAKNPRSFGTHDGTFHADEVTACALLLLFDHIDRDKIVRTRNPSELQQCEYVCDVGGAYLPKQKLFDHHQVEYQGPLSSAGMILAYLKEEGSLLKKEYDFLNHSIILGVDAHDNGQDVQKVGVCTYSHIISQYNPVHGADKAAFEKAFFEALAFSKGLLERIWNRYQYTQSCRQIVAEAMTRPMEYLMFDRNIPWLEIFFELEGEHHPALFVIMPSDGHWKLRGIPPAYDKRMQVRLPLPQEWAGLSDEDFKKASGIKGAIFCHKGRFISVWEKREDAIKAVEMILSKRKGEVT